MTDTKISEKRDIPQPGRDEDTAEKADTKVHAEDVIISVKFNKEMLKLTAEEAAVLAQKGMKYEQIEDEYMRLRKLAAQNGKSVSQFITELCAEKLERRKSQLVESCGGNTEVAEHIILLENAKEDDCGFNELKVYFPQFTDISQLPESVVSACELKGTRLLDEYLRYCLMQKRLRDNAESQRKRSQKASIGSQLAFSSERDPANMAFLQGIWGN